ncbi:MAG: SpoIIIAH-like family protein [Syntrophomonas sp.]|nr:SpoIIIAH-like family protein [Syntrophomonas sp.]
MIISIKKFKLIACISALFIISLLVFKLINSLNMSVLPTSNTAIKPTGTGINIVADKQSLDEDDNFFAEYRMKRERVRSKEIQLLKDIANDLSSDKKTRDTACLKLVELAERAEKEMQAEAMIKSQGFFDCAVIITPANTTTVMIENSVSAESQEEMRRAVSLATGSSEKNISIIKRHSIKD